MNFKNDRINFKEKIKSAGLPSYMYGAIERYVFNGIEPGSFLKAVLENNLMDAVSLADDNNINVIANWVKFLYWETPADCWQSEKHVRDWIASGGLDGRQRTSDNAFNAI